MEISPVYTSVSCNRTPAAADWGSKNNLVVFGACNSIGIFDPQLKSIVATYIGHTDRVNSVKWIRNPSGVDTELISCGNDGNVIYWNTQDPDQVTILKGHSGSVTSVDAVYIDSRLTVVSSSGDSTIKIWERKDLSGTFELLQTLDLKNGISFIVRLIRIPGTDNLMLLYSTDDDKVVLLVDKTIPDGTRQFSVVNQLKGHEDWVRGIDVIEDKEDLLIATSSQDTFIRLWRISPRMEKEQSFKKFSDLNENEDIQVQETRFAIVTSSGKEKIYAVSLESVLQGHEGWVYSVNWNREERDECSSSSGHLQLLSASIDKTIIVWRYDIEVGVWMESVRLGEVGGSSLGFFGAKFNHNGKSILGHGFQGSFHIWNKDSENDSSWSPGVIVGGHFSSVKDICWEPKGKFLLSVSTDQTTRIHAPWNNNRNGGDVTWHEVARPQVHGYDMQCITSLTRFQFASAAEEKIIRTFQAPANFIENIRGLSDPLEGDKEVEEILKSETSGASVPSLGLSNKSVSKTAAEAAPPETRHIKDQYPENYFVPVKLSEPPTEETLMQNTLWPENQKLYGHGYEVYSICSTSDGRYLASACKATNEEHARIILWDTKTWKQIDSLANHNLTVTQMRFSPDDQYLISVSRDRRFSLFERAEKEDRVTYTLKSCSDKTNGIHQRIIWSCDWSKDSKYFATSSREGKVVAWYKGEEDQKNSLGHFRAKDVLDIKSESITAVAFAHHQSSNGSYVVALGCTSGHIIICRLDEKWEICHQINPRFGHHLTVQRLMFQPNVEENVLASCGDDHIVRVYKIKL